MKLIKNERGQMTIEMLLMAIIFLAATIAISKKFRDENLLASMVEGPQTYIVGMAENGVWRPADKANNTHPNLHKRHMSLKGDN